MNIASLVGKKQGQSTIEFLATFGIAIIFLFIFIKFSLNVTKGYMIHFATFMASRAYMVADNFSQNPSSTDSNAAQIAQNDIFKKIVSDSSVSAEFISPDQATKKFFVGVVTSFSQKFAFSTGLGGDKVINFISESFLGRTIPYSECVLRSCAAIKGAVPSVNTNCNKNTTVYDNGC